jgi:hypothetical protein
MRGNDHGVPEVMTQADHDDGIGATPRRRGPRWRIPAAVALLAVAGGLACAPWMLSDPTRMSRLVARACPELDADVTFRSCRVGWTGPIVFEGVRIVPRDGAVSPLSVGRVEVAAGLAAILATWGDLGRVRVDGVEADVVFDDRRRSNLAGLHRPSPVADGPSTSRPPRHSPVRMRLEVEDALVRISGPWTAEPWRSEPIDVRAALGPAVSGAGSEWSVEPVELLADARLDPGVAQGVLAYIAPILAGATRTSGRFSLRLDGARLPVGRPADGTLSGVLAMHEVVVGPGPLVENLLAGLPARLPVPPDVRIADESHVAFRLAERRVVHEGLEFGLPLGRSGQRFDVHSAGSVGLDDGDLDLRLRLPIPTDLPQDRPVLASLAGKSVSVNIRGELGAPRGVFDGSIAETAGEVVVDLVERLRARAGATAPPNEPGASGTTATDTRDAVADIVAGIIEEVAKRRAERRAAEAENPDAVPPRRLRDRLRGSRGLDFPATP